MERTSFAASARRLWVHGVKPEFVLDDDPFDKWYIPGRTLSLVRARRDAIVLPGGNAPLREFARFCARWIGLEEWQILWTSGTKFVLDEEIFRELLPALQGTVGWRPQEWEIVPYAVTKPFLAWANGFPTIPVFGDHAAFVARYSDKACLQPDTPGTKHCRVLPFLPEVVPELRVARGYAAYDCNDLQAAVRQLVDRGVTSFVIKPVFGTTGEGIKLGIELGDPVLDDYDFPMGPVILEEFLDIDQDDTGRPIAPSVQYFGQTLFPGVTDQLCDGAVYQGNRFPSTTNAGFQEEMRTMAQGLLTHLRPNGPGGFDFLSVRGRPILSDPNVGRFTAAFPARLFADQYAPGSAFVCWKVDACRGINEFWELLRSRGAAFQDGRGVFPLCYLPGMWSMLGAFAQSPEALPRLQAVANECI